MSTLTIPGREPRPGRKYLYLQNVSATSFRDLFPTIALSSEGPPPKAGGAVNEEVGLTIPSGETLWAISFKGDLEGWRRKIIECAQGRKLLWGEISEEHLRLSDGRYVPLASCRVESSDTQGA